MASGAAKRIKISKKATCIICSVESPLSDLSKVTDSNSWRTLFQAANARQFEPILRLHADLPDVPVLYHRTCRSDFTHKKTLANVLSKSSSSSSVICGDVVPRRSSREEPACGQARVYERKCIFCDNVHKFIKGTRTREALRPAVELRADKMVRDAATARNDQRMLALTARDIVAAEAHYHFSCYRGYTRPQNLVLGLDNANDPQLTEKETAIRCVFDYIRNNVFVNPRIIPLVDIVEEALSSIQCASDVCISIKKNIQRTLTREFGESIIFFNAMHRVFLMPDSLTKQALGKQCVSLKSKLSALEQKDGPDINALAATSLRHDIKAVPFTDRWPPQPAELTPDYVKVPSSLHTFLRLLICGGVDGSARAETQVWSIALDVINAVSRGAIKTSKHVLLPWVIKILTGNAELINILNRLGHGCSYTALEEIETALCIDKIASVEHDAVPLPSNIHHSVQTVLAFDNIDRQEETLSGVGTSHRVNGVIVQPMSLSCLPPPTPCAVSKQDKKRTVQPSNKLLPIYTVGKREGPPAITPADLSGTLEGAASVAQRLNHIWLMTRMIAPSEQKVSSWTGFNIMTRNHIEAREDVVGYLPTINAPATDMSTVQEILCEALSIMSSLQLEHIPVVLDQALFAKATEIAWKDANRYRRIVLMMGNFHTICNFMSSIGKMFGDAGLRDVAVESGVIAEGSINRVLDGKQYNRAVRFHKLTYEALMRLVWIGFEPWLEENHPDELPKLHTAKRTVNNIHETTCHEMIAAALADDSCVQILDMFLTYLDIVRNKRGQLARFWMMYLDMVEILLGLIRADREGDWMLHLACIRKVIPWCFALNKVNYARYLPVYYAQMTHLEETCPQLYRHFEQGYFSVQLSHGNPFGRIAVDQTTEETVNKDTQTAGGTRGFSLREGTVSRYYITAEHRAAALRQLRENIRVSELSYARHPDVSNPRIQKDESDVNAIFQLLLNDWTNPFDKQPSHLVNISTGVAAGPDVSADLLHAQQKGEDAYNTFQEHRLHEGTDFYQTVKKMNLKTFCQAKEKVVKVTSKEVVLRADRQLFATMILIAKTRDLNMENVLCHPLGPLPWSLANVDGSMKKTNKAALSKHLESLVDPAENVTEHSATIIDAMALVQKMQGENRTFEELSAHILETSLNAGKGSGRIDVVFDTYKDSSIKSAERLARGASGGVTFLAIRPAHKIKKTGDACWRAVSRRKSW